MKPFLEWSADRNGVTTARLKVVDSVLVELDVDLPASVIAIQCRFEDVGTGARMPEAQLSAENALERMLAAALNVVLELKRKRNREEEFERQAATHLTPEQVTALKVGDEVAIYQDRGDLCWTGVVRSRTPKRGRLRVCGPHGQSELFDDRGIQVSNRDRWHTRYLGPAVPAKEG